MRQDDRQAGRQGVGARLSPDGRPRFSPAAAEAVVLERYGLAGRASPLPSERDQNFKVVCGSEGSFVLKLFHADEAPALVEAQRRVFEVLEQLPRRVFPRLRPTLRGEAYGWVTLDPTVAERGGLSERPERSMRSAAAEKPMAGTAGGRNLAWLTDFMPGVPAATMATPSVALLRDIGGLLGETDAVLAQNPQPAARRTFAWAAQTAPEVIARHLERVAPTRRPLVSEVLGAFEAEVRPHVADLRVSLIHNDVNDNNLLVERDRVSAILDFGDMLESYTVCELAHAAAYLMLDQRDPLETARALARGYQASYPLRKVELGVLYDFIRLRLALSVTLSAYQQVLEPDDPYLRVSEAPAWRLLERFARGEPSRAHVVEAMVALGGTA